MGDLPCVRPAYRTCLDRCRSAALPSRDMSLIADVRADHYRIPLPTALSDSTHGTIVGFELVTVRLRDADGGEGVGYTYTVGTGGAAVHALVARDLARLLAGRDAERIEALW